MSWSLEQVSLHNKPSSCWVIINAKVYDVTDFLLEHPGGSKIILKYAGADATAAYEPIHPPDALDNHLPKDKHLGPLSEAASNDLERNNEHRIQTRDEKRVEQARLTKPPLSHILSLRDMEKVARKVLSYKALAYYASASDDEVTLSQNALAFTRFFFQPRILRPVALCTPQTTILSYPSALPIFVSGSALARLGHPLGEINITRGCHRPISSSPHPIIQMVSSNASLSPAQIMEAAAPGQTLFFQLYKRREDDVAEQRVRGVERLGYKAIFLTVDALVPGNRERDIAAPWVLGAQENNALGLDAPRDLQDLEREEVGEIEEVQLGGTAGMLVAGDDRDMSWEKTIPWLRKVTKLPIVVKGVQCVADAVLAAEAGVDGILLSNHGGRQLDYSPPPMEILYKIRRQRPEVFDKLEVYIDGGVSRGTDVLKALCLGATAVGLGRPFLYAQSAYGQAGVTKIIRILEREIVTGMRLLGARNVKELVPEMVERVDWQLVNVQAKL